MDSNIQSKQSPPSDDDCSEIDEDILSKAKKSCSEVSFTTESESSVTILEKQKNPTHDSGKGAQFLHPGMKQSDEAEIQTTLNSEIKDACRPIEEAGILNSSKLETTNNKDVGVVGNNKPGIIIEVEEIEEDDDEDTSLWSNKEEETETKLKADMMAIPGKTKLEEVKSDRLEHEKTSDELVKSKKVDLDRSKGVIIEKNKMEIEEKDDGHIFLE